MNPRSQTAQLPPPGLIGLDPAWSRLVTTVDTDGIERTWHVLDTGGEYPRATVLCVHGNPNWSYMFRGLLQSLPDCRVVAVDALNMGFSERTGTVRPFATHIADLVAVTDALDLDGPVITVAHDWGGPISMGWAQQNVDRLAGVVLMNTGVARPEAVKVPPLISIARATLRMTCETTPTFLHGALRMARPQLARDVYRGYTAPYRSAARRTGIRDFVEDIPIEETHESFEPLASVAAGLAALQEVPTLLLWGSKDIIFSDAFLHDLVERLPHASVHRYADAGHQIIEDTDATDVIGRWVEQRLGDRPTPIEPASPADNRIPIWSAIDAGRGDARTAIIEMDPNNTHQVLASISFDELATRVDSLARGLRAMGIASGDRLATLVPPGLDLTVLVYACLRAGITIVAPDAALGIDGLRRALRSSRPDYVVGDWRGLSLAKALRLPATRLSVSELPASAMRALGAKTSLATVRAHASDAQMPAEPTSDADAAVVFTSGSTGPSKGVVYTHRQLEAQRDAVRSAFSLDKDDRLVVAFAPFAVLAPALGIPSVVPPMDVTKPGELDAATVADAATALDATIVFASPAVLANIAATAATAATDIRNEASNPFAAIRAVATAGAPVSPHLLAAAQPLFPHASFFTPYGMTELMPVTMAAADEIVSGSTTNDAAGVCVGPPLPTVEIAIRPVDTRDPAGPDQVPVGHLGEVCVRAAHGSTRYDRLWGRDQQAFHDGWHRSGDVGRVDARGRLWIEGRVDHLITTATGIVAPVPLELGAESVPGVRQAAAVGIGPAGTQHVAIVLSGDVDTTSVVADAATTQAVRRAVAGEVAAVLVVDTIPVDRRHNSKIDRNKVQRWASAVLRGERPPRL